MELEASLLARIERLERLVKVSDEYTEIIEGQRKIIDNLRGLLHAARYDLERERAAQ
jgi:hypothetical protein